MQNMASTEVAPISHEVGGDRLNLHRDKVTRGRGGSLPGERRGGRAKGTPNKLPGQIKEMVLQALQEAGGVRYLKAVAHSHPVAFCGLLGRVLPLQVTGAGGGQLVVEIVRFGELPHPAPVHEVIEG